MPDPSAIAILELRRYLLRRGRREALIDLFERRFVEPQEACGIRLVGTFRDLDAPDRFTWLRGFADMSARADALAAFYGGPVWQRHRDEANATMVDSDDVHLMRPLGPGDAFAAPGPRLSFGALVLEPAGIVSVTLCALREPPGPALAAAFDACVRPRWDDDDATLLACYASAPDANNFPRLPVHEGEPVVAWFTRHACADAHARHAARIAEAGVLQAPAWRERLLAAPLTFRLCPTSHSALR